MREREALQAALQIAEHGLTLEGTKVFLATWMADLALGMGETERALEAALIAFHGAPELAAYQRVQELAGERWPELRTELLAHLRQGRAYVPQGAVEIFLYEGLVEDAMRAVERGASYTLLEQVVDAAIPEPCRPGRSRPAVNRQSLSCIRDNRSITITPRAGWRRHGRPIALLVARRSGRAIWQS